MKVEMIDGPHGIDTEALKKRKAAHTYNWDAIDKEIEEWKASVATNKDTWHKKPEFHDTEGWREVRNKALRGWVRDEMAVRWLLDYFDVCELFDDLIDGDREVSKGRIV